MCVVLVVFLSVFWFKFISDTHIFDTQGGMCLGYILKSIIYPAQKNSKKSNLERFL